MDWSQFSMPWGDARPFPPPPHAYRNVEDLVISFEAERQAIASLLPPLVEPEGDPVPCQAKFRWAPFSVHGPYHEAYVAATVRFGGERYRFPLLIYTDNEIPLIAGREIWGYPKKLARMWRTWQTAEGVTGEHMLACVERPAGLRLMTMGMVCDRQADPPSAPGLPALSLKYIPGADGGPPAVAQLIRLDGKASFVKAADGTPFFFEGRPSLSFDATSSVDPLYRLRPTKLKGAAFMKIDFAHGPGTVVHDYLR
jgi:acetoacetate decarboxylase